MFDEFYRLKFNPFFRTLCMKFEGEGGNGGEGKGGNGGGEGESWLDAHDYLSDDDKQTLSKYDTQQAAIEATVHSTRKFAEYDEQIKSAVHFPDDTTSDEDKTKFNEKVAVYQGVPDKAENYVLARPEKLPEGMAWDEGLEKWFRDKMAATKTPQSIASQLFNDYCERMVGQHTDYQGIAKKAEKELRDEIHDDGMLAWFGDSKDKENIGSIRQTVLKLSELLKLDYKGEDGSPQSKLADCLELQRKNGCQGDMIPILKVLNFCHEHYFKEGASMSGELAKTKTEEGEGVFAFKDMDGDGKNEEVEFGAG